MTTAAAAEVGPVAVAAELAMLAVLLPNVSTYEGSAVRGVVRVTCQRGGA